MRKVMLVFGSTPEAIKMAPLVKAFQQEAANHVETIICITGQQGETLYPVLNIYDIDPDYNLNIIQEHDHSDVITRVLSELKEILREVKPDVVLVIGDSTYSTAAALAAYYEQIPLGHIEAGIRTQHLYNSWPEEKNRNLISNLASYHFAPTAQARQNLLREGVEDESIIVTGNTIIDAMRWLVGKFRKDVYLDSYLHNKLEEEGYDTHRVNEGKRMVLISEQRRENFAEGFEHLCKAIRTLSQKYPDVDFIYPMHLNQMVRKYIYEIFSEDMFAVQDNLFLIEPLDINSFIYLMEKSTIILTDNGGIQEAGPALHKPVLVMRDSTQREEAVNAGMLKLVGTNYDKIVNMVSTLLDNQQAYQEMSSAVNPYGDGTACSRIVNALMYRVKELL